MLLLAAIWALPGAGPARAAEDPAPTEAPPSWSPSPEQERQLDDRARAVLEGCVREDMSDVEKLTAIHDWLCLHCEYGATPHRTTAYGAVVEGLAVCNGYAEGLAFLADMAGLDGASTYSREIDHAWTLVTLDGDRYFSDATWDDGKHALLGMVRHRNFLFDQDSAGDTSHTGWDSPEDVPGGPMEAVPWAAAVTQVIFGEKYCWYIDTDFTLRRCDRATWETEALLTMSQRWTPWDQPGYIYTSIYSSLILSGGRLWFNTPQTVCSVALDGTDMRVELEPELPPEREIYGIAEAEGVLRYSLSRAPDDVVFDTVDTDIPLPPAGEM